MCGVDMDSLATPTGTIVDAPKMAAVRNAADALVYVNEDGSVRELTEAEKKYVDTEFSPLDGARPYVKSRIRTAPPGDCEVICRSPMCHTARPSIRPRHKTRCIHRLRKRSRSR